MTMPTASAPAGGPPPLTADGLAFAAAIVDDQPALLLNFRMAAGQPQLPLIRLIMPGDEMEKLPPDIADAVKKSLEASGYVPRPEGVCRGTCGRKLFGEMAERGICRECQPDDEVAAEPADTQP